MDREAKRALIRARRAWEDLKRQRTKALKSELLSDEQIREHLLNTMTPKP